MAEEYSICLDIGGTKVLGAIFDKNEKPVYRLKKKTKSGVRPTDIKPMIYELTSQESSIWTTLSLCEERSCKPELLLHALAEFCGKPLPQVLITRLALFAEKDGCFIPLEDA